LTLCGWRVEWVFMNRIKVIGATAVYHCISRAVGGEMLFGSREKEVLRKQLWQVAGFCGVEVLTYCLMSNHFHVLVRVREVGNVSDEELLRRFGLLYHREKGRVQALGGILKAGGKEAEKLRAQLLARMGDVSVFMKELKQRFSIWYNHTHKRYGTLWAERFKSVLVEGSLSALRTVAAYIDLNPVRAGLVKDPRDYRFCGYAEALAGARQAQAGIRSVNESKRIDSALEQYRMTLFGMGSSLRRESQKVISTEKAMAVIAKGGKLPLPTILRCRVRYMTDGAVLGSQKFVSDYFNAHRESFGKRRTKAFNRMKGGDWSGLVVLRGLRSDIFT